MYRSLPYIGVPTDVAIERVAKEAEARRTERDLVASNTVGLDAISSLHPGLLIVSHRSPQVFLSDSEDGTQPAYN